ncbi:MAG: GGDEF domain-containing protein [Alphaproteobacteria bacterium]
MKVERFGSTPAGVGKVRSNATGRTRPADGGSAHAVDDTSEILGIPEAELTPKVRAALMQLMAEVTRLRDELARNRGRIDHLEKLADQDSLLPIYNRRAFVRELTRVISMTERYGQPSSIIFLDVNGLKRINDQHGHGAGDAVLMNVADRLRLNVRESDIVGRLGGDEFGVILFNADPETARAKAAALAADVAAAPIAYANESFEPGVTFGTYTFTGKEDPAQAIAAADEDMYARRRSTNGDES